MAAENIDNTPNGAGLFNTKIPGLSDAADIQAALRLYHYGTYEYDGANTDPLLLPNPSIAKHLQNLVNADATLTSSKVAKAGDTMTGALTLSGAPTANLHAATKSYVDTGIANAIAGAVGGYDELAGEGIDWNIVDERFDLNYLSTVLEQTSNFSLLPAYAGSTQLLSTSSTITLTVPKNSTTEIQVGYKIDLIEYGTGTTTIAPEVGVTVNSKNARMYLDGRYSKGTLLKVGTDAWVFYGDVYENIATPTPVAPTPVPTAPTPVPTAPTPVPTAPTPVPTTPVAPVGPTPTPTTPTPTTPTPTTPTPTTPTPTTPTPTTPTPTTPTPTTPTPTATTYDIYVTCNGFSGNYSGAYGTAPTGSGISNLTGTTETSGLTSAQIIALLGIPTACATVYNIYVTCNGFSGNYSGGYGVAPTGAGLSNISGTTETQGLTSAEIVALLGIPSACTPTPAAPTPAPVAPTATTYDIYVTCNGFSGNYSGGYGTAPTGSGISNLTGTTTTQGLSSAQIIALLGIPSSCATTPTPVPVAPVAPTPVPVAPTAPTPVPVTPVACTPNVSSYNEYRASCNAVVTIYVDSCGNETFTCPAVPTPVPVAPVAPTPVPVAPDAPVPAPVAPTAGLPSCPGTITNPANATCSELGLTRLGGSAEYAIPSGQSCCGGAVPTAPVPAAPVAPVPAAPVAPVPAAPVAPVPAAPTAPVPAAPTASCTDTEWTTNFNFCCGIDYCANQTSNCGSTRNVVVEQFGCG